MCGLTSSTVPITACVPPLFTAYAVSGETSQSRALGEPKTAALSSRRRAKRAGPIASVALSTDGLFPRRLRTCPPWDCIDSLDDAYYQWPASSEIATFLERSR